MACVCVCVCVWAWGLHKAIYIVQSNIVVVLHVGVIPTQAFRC
jgi:hypothetical protein